MLCLQIDVPYLRTPRAPLVSTACLLPEVVPLECLFFSHTPLVPAFHPHGFKSSLHFWSGFLRTRDHREILGLLSKLVPTPNPMSVSQYTPTAKAVYWKVGWVGRSAPSQPLLSQELLQHLKAMWYWLQCSAVKKVAVELVLTAGIY